MMAHQAPAVIELPITKGGMDYLKCHIRQHGYSKLRELGLRVDQVDWDGNAAFLDWALREVANA